MYEFQTLLTMLRRELDNQEALLEVLVRERAAIVKLNQEEIEKISGEKQALLNTAHDTQTKCIELMRQLAAVKDATPAKMTEIVGKCPVASLRKQLTLTCTELKKTTETVKDLHSNNSLLIRQALGLIASTVSILASGPEENVPVYGGRGRMNQAGNRVSSAARARSLSQEA